MEIPPPNVASVKAFYVSAIKIVNDVSCEEDSLDRVLYVDSEYKFVVSKHVDNYLHHVDVANALGVSVVGSLAGKSVQVKEAIYNVVALRKKQLDSCPALLFKGETKLDIDISKKIISNDGYKILFGVDVENVKSNFLDIIRIMKIVYASHQNDSVEFRQVIDGVYFVVTDNEIAYPINLSASSSCFRSSAISEKDISDIRLDFSVVKSDERALVIAQYMEALFLYNSDPHKSFFSAWAALEIILDVVLSDYVHCNPAKLNSLSEKAKRVADFFIAKGMHLDSEFLCPTIRNIQKLRNDFVHGRSACFNFPPDNIIKKIVKSFYLGYVRLINARNDG